MAKNVQQFAGRIADKKTSDTPFLGARAVNNFMAGCDRPVMDRIKIINLNGYVRNGCTGTPLASDADLRSSGNVRCKCDDEPLIHDDLEPENIFIERLGFRWVGQGDVGNNAFYCHYVTLKTI